MPRYTHMAFAAVLSFALLSQSACSGRYMQGDVIHSEAQIRNNAENAEVVELVDTYRHAVEARDVNTLRGLVSRDYYENSGTTNTTEDDYGYEGLDNLFDILTHNVEETRLNVKIRDIRVYGERADVVFEYAYTMLYNVGDTQRWQTERDVNRFQLHKVDGVWLIVSGL